MKTEKQQKNPRKDRNNWEQNKEKEDNILRLPKKEER